MNKTDVTFTVGLDTSPAEQQLDKLYAKMQKPIKTSPLLQQVSNEYSQGFKMVGSAYDSGSNRFGVPSTKVLETALVSTAQTIQRFNAVVTSVIQMSNSMFDSYIRHATQPRIGFDNNTFSPYRNNPYKVLEEQFHKNFWHDKFQSATEQKYLTYDKTFEMVGESYSKMYPAVWNGSRGAGNIPPILSNGGADGIDTPEENGKDIVEQEKKDNDELKEKLLLWSKIGATIYAIRKVISGLAKVWKFGADITSSANSNLNEEHGFFSIDPEGAFRANTDKTRAILYAGLRNMGENAPVSKEGLDYASSKMTEMWTAAMSGRNVDARTTIDVQRLKDFFGIDLTVAGLLTGEREGKTATDLQIDMMEKVEAQLSKLAEADEVTKGQVIDSLKNILGDELVNAIVANANKNLKIDATDLKLTLAERIMQFGGTAVPSGNLTETSTKAVTAISELNTAVKNLKNTLVQELGPAFSTLTGVLTKLINWINKRVNKVEGTQNAAGEIEYKTSVASLTNDYNAYKDYKQKENDKNDAFKNKVDRIKTDMKSKNVFDRIEALYLAQIESETAADIENLGIKATQDVIGTHLAQGYLDKNSENPVERALAKYTWTDSKGRKYTGYEAFKQQIGSDPNAYWVSDQMRDLFWNPQKLNEAGKIRAYIDFLKNNPKAKEAFISAFDKGGALDYGTGMNIGKYLLNRAFYSSGEDYLNFWKEMEKQSHEVLDNSVDVETSWADTNRNGKVDFGEVVITLVGRNINGEEEFRTTLQGAVQ